MGRKMSNYSANEILKNVYGPAIAAELEKSAKLLRSFDPRSDEQIEKDREAYRIRMQEEASYYGKVVNEAADLSLALLTLHSRDKQGYCTECSDYENDVSWPCSTASLAIQESDK
jgi:hypothetical protein